jgi:hypothetical protein
MTSQRFDAERMMQCFETKADKPPEATHLCCELGGIRCASMVCSCHGACSGLISARTQTDPLCVAGVSASDSIRTVGSVTTFSSGLTLHRMVVSYVTNGHGILMSRSLYDLPAMLGATASTVRGVCGALGL